MLVMKFGGTSVDGPQSIGSVVDLVLAEHTPGRGVVVVVSAMAGTTNALLGAARAAACGEERAWTEALEELARRHRSTAGALTDDADEHRAILSLIDRTVDGLIEIFNSIAVLGEVSPRGLDRVLATGERLSAPLVALALRGRGVNSVAVESCAGLIVTDQRFGEARPDAGATGGALREKLEPMLAGGVVPVVTGFIGSTPDGRVTTLGRGGSDCSAAIVGAALGAEEVWIWSDVDGILTADPKIVATARAIPHLSYITAAELAACGAEVLHPRTVRPLARRGVPLRLKNTFNPSHPGTLVSGRDNGHPPAIISTAGLAMLTVQAEVEGWTSDTLPACLGRLARSGVDVLFFVQSAWLNGGTVLIRASDSEAAVNGAAADSLKVCIRPGVATVAVIGPGVVGPAMAALAGAGVNVLATLQASTDTGLIIAVPEDQLKPLVRHLHDRLNLTGEEIE